jgi:acyl carrier protein
MDRGGGVTVNALAPSEGQVARHVGDFIAGSLLLDGSAGIGMDDPLLVGRIDSAGLMELLTFLEVEYDIVVEPGDIDEVQFGTLRRITDLVVVKLDAREYASGVAGAE